MHVFVNFRRNFKNVCPNAELNASEPQVGNNDEGCKTGFRYTECAKFISLPSVWKYVNPDYKEVNKFACFVFEGFEMTTSSRI